LPEPARDPCLVLIEAIGHARPLFAKAAHRGSSTSTDFAENVLAAKARWRYHPFEPISLIGRDFRVCELGGMLAATVAVCMATGVWFAWGSRAGLPSQPRRHSSQIVDGLALRRLC